MASSLPSDENVSAPVVSARLLRAMERLSSADNWAVFQKQYSRAVPITSYPPIGLNVARPCGPRIWRTSFPVALSHARIENSAVELLTTHLPSGLKARWPSEPRPSKRNDV